MADDQAYTFDRSSLRFRSLETGRFVPERDVRVAVDAVADLASRRLGEASARYRAGQITVTEFQAELMATIKESQIAAGLLAYGGRQQMDASRWGLVGQQIRVQYQYARGMIADVLDGRQRLNGRLDGRARQYGQAARSLYENLRRRQSAEAGMAFEQNVLHAAESCRECLAATAAGVVPIGTLPPIGQRICRQSCRCTLSYSRTMSEAEAA